MAWILTRWVLARRSNAGGVAGDGGGGGGAHASGTAWGSDPLLGLAAAALPGCGVQVLAVALELCVYDTAAGAAALWLMRARWRRWVLCWLAWAGATVCMHGGGRGARVARASSRGEVAIPAAAADGREVKRQRVAACGRVVAVLSLQIVVPVLLGWAVPWP